MKLSKGVKTGVIIILLIGFFVVLNLTGLSKNVKNLFYSASSPVQKKMWGAGDNVSNFFKSISGNRNLQKQNEELRLKIEELSAENAKLKELKNENEFLRQALNIDLQKDFSLILADTIGKDVEQDIILINKGEKDGIKKGFTVITQQKAMVGKVFEVYDNYSKVMLVSNKKSNFMAKIAEKDVLGELKGEGGSKIFLDRIPLDKEAKTGDIVITAVDLNSVSENIPEGILFGTIKEVKKIDVETFQRAEIEPAFNLRNLDKVFIIVNF